MRSIGKLEKAHAYSAFDFHGHQTLFSDRNTRNHSARGNLSRCFSTASIESKIDIIDKHVAKVVKVLQARLKDANGEIVEVNLLEVMMSYGVDVASDYMSGQSYRALGRLQIEEPEKLSSVGAFNSPFVASLPVLLGSTRWPILGYLDWIYQKVTLRRANEFETSEFSRINTFANQFADSYLERHSMGELEKDDNDYISVLIQSGMYRGKARETLVNNLTAEIVDPLFAAGDVTGNVLAMGLVTLFSRGQDKVQQVWDSNESKCNDLVASLIDTFLWFNSANPRSLDRVVGSQGLQLDDGTVLPMGVTIGVSPAALHRSFLPSKDKDDPFSLPSEVIDKIQLLEFEYPGARFCTAKNLARVQTRAMAKAFVKNFDIVIARQVEEEQLRLARDTRTSSLPGGKLIVKIKARLSQSMNRPYDDATVWY